MTFGVPDEDTAPPAQTFEEAILFILNEMIHGGARLCTPAERRVKADQMISMLERLKAIHGLPAGRGDSETMSSQEKAEAELGNALKAFT